MTHSFWENRYYQQTSDYVIVGAGFTGCFLALALRQRKPTARIQVIERSALSRGASSKNAGFLCIGSLSELLANERQIGTQRLTSLLTRRWMGRGRLLSFLRKHQISVDFSGGAELFAEAELERYEQCYKEMCRYNELLSEITGHQDFFVDGDGLSGIREGVRSIRMPQEGMLDPVSLLTALHRELGAQGIQVHYRSELHQIKRDLEGVWRLHTRRGAVLKASQVVLATNSLAARFWPDCGIRPVRNQVIVTEPIEHSLEHCIHVDQGYFYMRPFGQMLLIGGGRHRLGESEETASHEVTVEARELLLAEAQKYLEISSPQVRHQWSGTLGIHKSPEPLLLSEASGIHLVAGLGGMGVCIASQLAEELAESIV